MIAFVVVPKKFADTDMIKNRLDGWPLTEILCNGDEPGRQILKEYASARGIHCAVKKPNYAFYGKQAKSINDDKIFDRVFLVIIFDDNSKYASIYFNKALKRQKPTHAIHMHMENLALNFV